MEINTPEAILCVSIQSVAARCPVSRSLSLSLSPEGATLRLSPLICQLGCYPFFLLGYFPIYVLPVALKAVGWVEREKKKVGMFESLNAILAVAGRIAERSGRAGPFCDRVLARVLGEMATAVRPERSDRQKSVDMQRVDNAKHLCKGGL